MRCGRWLARSREDACSCALGVHPVFKRIDTCAAEFEAKTPYMYSTYEAPMFGDARVRGRAVGPPQDRHPGRRTQPHRPGHRVRLLLLPRLLRAGRGRLETIMVNCNPETVSTDYDTSDRLYFEPLTPRTCSRSSGRAAERRAAGRDRAVRRADAAEAGQGAGRGRHPDPRHLARRDRPGRRPRAFSSAAQQAASSSRQRHRRSRDEAIAVSPTASAIPW
jgi:hypothetical protein